MALRISDLTAATSFVGTDLFEFSLAGAAGSRYSSGSNVRKQLLAGGTGFTATDPVNAGIATLAGGTVTTSQPVWNVTQTWNDAAVTFVGLLANFTSTASAAASLVIDLQVGASSVFKVSKAGAVTATGLITGSAGLTISSGTSTLQAVTTTTLDVSGLATMAGIFATVATDTAVYTGRGTTSGDRFDVVVRTAGNGIQLQANNFANSDFSPMLIVGNGVVINSRNGVQTSVQVASFTSTGLALNTLAISGVTTLAASSAITSTQGASSAAFVMAATGRLYLDGGSNTFIDEVSADAIRIVCGGAETARFTTAGLVMNTLALSGVTTLAIGGALTGATTGTFSTSVQTASGSTVVNTGAGAVTLFTVAGAGQYIISVYSTTGPVMLMGSSGDDGTQLLNGFYSPISGGFAVGASGHSFTITNTSGTNRTLTWQYLRVGP